MEFDSNSLTRVYKAIDRAAVGRYIDVVAPIRDLHRIPMTPSLAIGALIVTISAFFYVVILNDTAITADARFIVGLRCLRDSNDP